MTPARKILMLLLFLGLAGNIGGTGTLASFNASTTNAGSTFASGTIVLQNTKYDPVTNNPTVCVSAVGNTNTNANGSCVASFNTTVAKPGTTATVDLTLENVGSLPGTLRLYAPGVCASANDAGAYHGTGNLCNAVQMVIQRYSSLANRTANNTTGGTCVYSLSGANPCVLDSTRTVGHFASTHTSGVNGISLGTLAGAIAGDTDTAFVRITLSFPNGTPANDNQFQGLIATWGYTWLLEQN